MKRIFVLEKTHHDISQLEEMGEVVYLFEIGRLRKPIFDPEFEWQITERLNMFRFNPAEDFIAVVGQLVPIAITVAAVISKYGCFVSLCYDARESSYVQRFMGTGAKAGV